MKALVLAAALAATLPGSADATGNDTTLACSLCDALSGRMSGEPGQPFFFQSFEPGDGKAKFDPSLQDAAFTYDNALALMALYACGRRDEGKRVADALLMALERDRHYRDGRLRNAYRAGPLVPSADGTMLAGYWNPATKAWQEDSYQAGSATGSTAWGALALLAAHAETGDVAYLSGARRVMGFIHASAADPDNPGYFGGFFGHEPAPERVTWKSTEHNLDVYAADRWLAGLEPEGEWGRHAGSARAFLDAMWAESKGHFHIGSVPGSNSPNTDASGLDAQLWPLIAVDDFKAKAPRVLAWAEAHHGVRGGFDFNADRDGIWLEGTAQAALAYRVAGDPAKAEPLLATLAAQVSPSGLVYATAGEELTTGLSVGPGSETGDFKYYRLPHMGATGWAVLAAFAINPFKPDGFKGRAERCEPRRHGVGP